MPSKYKKRQDGRYSTHVTVGTKPDGRPQRKTLYAKTIRELETKIAELREQVDKGNVTNYTNITLGEWAEKWLNIYKSGVEFNTKRMYSYIVESYVKPTIGFLRLKDVKTIHLQEVINSNQDKSWVVKKFKLTVNQIFEQAINNDMLAKNPAKGIKLPTIQKNTTKRALTDDEIEKIKSLNLDGKTKCFVHLLLYTGMRKSEALALTKSDINREAMEINVNKTLIFKVNQSEVKNTTKTKAGNRTLPILSPLKDTLFAYLDSLQTEELFTTKHGKTLTDTAYRHMWRKFETAMGTRAITAHIFRHNFATMLYNAEIDVKTAQILMGHDSITVMLGIYTHLGKNKIKQNIGKLEDFICDI